MSDVFKALIAEAKRQNRYKPTLSKRLIAVAKYQPFRAIWCARVAWLLHRRWNAPKGHEARCTPWQSWLYAQTMAEMLESGPLFPLEAIDIDRTYWSE